MWILQQTLIMKATHQTPKMNNPYKNTYFIKIQPLKGDKPFKDSQFVSHRDNSRCKFVEQFVWQIRIANSKSNSSDKFVLQILRTIRSKHIDCGKLTLIYCIVYTTVVSLIPTFVLTWVNMCCTRTYWNYLIIIIIINYFLFVHYRFRLPSAWTSSTAQNVPWTVRQKSKFIS